MYIYLVLVVLFRPMCGYQEYNYCCLSPNHTLCLYKEAAEFGFNCDEVINSDISRLGIKMILQKLNYHRQLTAIYGLEKSLSEPDNNQTIGIADMEIMSWDTELANSARIWASQCRITLDTYRDVGRFEVAQIIETTEAFEDEEDILDRILDTWTYYDPKWNVKECDFSLAGKTGDTVWKEKYCIVTRSRTNRVGCGISEQKLKKTYSQKIWKELLKHLRNFTLVCNFGPSPGRKKILVKPKLRRGRYLKSIEIDEEPFDEEDNYYNNNNNINNNDNVNNDNNGNKNNNDNSQAARKSGKVDSNDKKLRKTGRQDFLFGEACTKCPLGLRCSKHLIGLCGYQGQDFSNGTILKPSNTFYAMLYVLLIIFWK